MDSLSTHYARLLGLDDSWRVDAVGLRIHERRVEIRQVLGEMSRRCTAAICRASLQADIRHQITDATSKRLDSVIQALKTTARGLPATTSPGGPLLTLGLQPPVGLVVRPVQSEPARRH